MPLPKVVTPQYTLVIPSLKKEIKYRPFLVKEEKILIIAQESEDPEQIADAVKTVISNCILTRGIKIEQLATFDIEYLFLNIRGKSVGEELELNIICPDDGETTVPIKLMIDDIQVQKNSEHSNRIKLDDSLMMEMKYPSLEQFIKNNFDPTGDNAIEQSFELIATCIEKIFNEEEVWVSGDVTKKELIEFLDQMNSIQFREIEKFFETMPKLSHTIKVKNPNTGIESEVVLEGLSSFFE